jgi:hypothetical protein
MAADLKSVDPARVPGVRIPSPPLNYCVFLEDASGVIGRRSLRTSPNSVSAGVRGRLDVYTDVDNNVAMKRSTTIRIEPITHEKLNRLAQAADIILTEALNRAANAYDRAEFFATLKQQVAALRADPKVWQEELDEQGAMERRGARDRVKPSKRKAAN